MVFLWDVGDDDVTMSLNGMYVGAGQLHEVGEVHNEEYGRTGGVDWIACRRKVVPGLPVDVVALH